MKRFITGALASGSFLLMSPAIAFADEESISGTDLLVPKPAEFIPALIIFLIIWALLAKFVWPQIMKTMDTREKRIKGSIDDADQLKAEAEEERQKAEQIVVDAHREASEIVLAARRDASEEHDRIVLAARDEANRIVAEARDRAENEKRLMYDHATDAIAELSVSVAAKIIEERLSKDDEAQRRVIKKYLTEVGSYNG